MDRRVFAAEVSHENTAVQVLEQLVFPPHKIAAILTDLKKELDEVFIITTRDRFAIYAVGNDFSPVVNFFARLQGVSPYVRYLTNSENAVHHLFATAAGLHSRVKGEHQILLQLRDAYLFALTHQTIGIVLDTLLRRALCAGKSVRTQTGIDKFCASVLDIGLLILSEKLGNLKRRKFLVLGTGNIARLSLRWMRQQGINHVRVVGHDPARTKELAMKYNVTPGSMPHVHRYFHQADVIIGDIYPEFAQSFDVPLYAGIRHALGLASIKPKIILDFGVPPNFDDSLRYHRGVELYNLDDLKGMVESPLDGMGGIGKAWELTRDETYKALLILRPLRISSVLTIRDWLAGGDCELEDLYRKLNGVSHENKELIEKYAHKLIRNISKSSLTKFGRVGNEENSKLARQESVKNLCSLKDFALRLFDN